MIEFLFQILLDILGNATQFEPHVLLIKLVEFLYKVNYGLTRIALDCYF